MKVMFLLVITIASFDRTASSSLSPSSLSAASSSNSTCISGSSAGGCGSGGTGGSAGMSGGVGGGGEVTVWEVLIVVFCVTSSLYGSLYC